MNNSSDVPSGSTPYVDRSDFSYVSDFRLPDPAGDQDLASSFFVPNLTYPSSAASGIYEIEQGIPQNHDTHATSVNDFANLLNSSSQATEYVPLNHESIPVGASGFQNNSYHSLQSSFGFANDFSMDDSAFDLSTELSNLSDKTKELRCTFSNCSEDIFSTYPAFQKHLNKHTKPYHCSVPDCRNPQFGDKGGLDRHKREVHGPNRHYCPITSCKRNQTGFPRKYNLFEHQKRCHPQLPTIALSTRRNPRDLIAARSESMEDIHKLDEDVSSPEGEIAGDVSTPGGEKVQEKLRALLALRVEIDRDIETLKRTVDILDEL